ncbi:MAG: Era-like GTP-binding protein [Candidatus Baldrarchaeia archaeon]
MQPLKRRRDTFGLEEAERWIRKLFEKREKKVVLGIYGAPNAGKTTLANRIAMDCNVEPKGVVSEIPHETREVIKIENLNLNINGKNLQLTILDTPGLATKISHLEFIKYGLSESEAIQRTKEALKGITKAIESMDEIDAAITVIDSTKMPYEQINIIIIGTLEAKRKPTIIAANKKDLPEAKPELVKKFYPNHQVVPISALTGQNIEKLYKILTEII